MGKIAISDLENIPCLSRKTINTLIKELNIPVQKERSGKQYKSVIDENYLIDMIVYIYATRSLRKLANDGIDISNRNEVTREIREKSSEVLLRELEEHLTYQTSKLKEIQSILKEKDSSKYIPTLTSLAKSTVGISQENVVILDTSIFHKKPAILDELVEKFSRIIIPSVVLRELNYQKDSKNKKLDKKKVSLILGSIRKYKDKLVLSDNMYCENTYNNDDLIIEVAKKEVSENVYILTEDGDFDIKCKDLPNITVLSLEGYELEFNSVNSEIDYEKTMAFINAVKNRNSSAVREMNLENVDVNSCGDNGQTALITAIRNRDREMIDVLINHCKVDLNTLDKNKYSIPALTHAIMIDRFDIVKLLIEKGADINLGSQGANRGNTPLMIASWNGNLKVVEFLLNQKEICINQQDSNGFTPLIKSAIRSRDNITEVLLKHGADKYIRSFDDKTALDYAKDNLRTRNSKSAQRIINLLTK